MGEVGWRIVESRDPAEVLTVRAVLYHAEVALGRREPLQVMPELAEFDEAVFDGDER